MSPEIVELVSQWGSLGVASGFIAWLYVKMQHRLDDMVEKFQGQLDAMSERGDSRVNELRNRYDKIIDRYNAERDTLHLGITSHLQESATTLKEVSDRVDLVGEHVQTGLAEMRQHYAVLEAERKRGPKC